MIIKICLFFVAILVYRIAINLYRYKSIDKYQEEYAIWISTNKDSFVLVAKIPSIKELMQHASITDVYVPFAHNLGYGQGALSQVNVFDLIPTRDRDYVQCIYSLLVQAKGIYYRRLINSFNPLFWINSLIYLPRTIFAYLGLKSDSFITRLLQVVWWFFAPIAIALRTDLYEFFGRFFNLP